MKFNFFFSTLLIVALVACKSPEARKPTQQSSGTFIDQSIERNKKIYEEEKLQIQALIDANPSTEFIASDSGFWYYYNDKDSISGVTPNYGDEVTFTYNIKKLDGALITSSEENGLQAYKIDQSNQDLISGIRDGVKLMQVGETVTFLLPSYKAYGYYGIENKLGTNVPIQSTVTLKTIEPSQD